MADQLVEKRHNTIRTFALICVAVTCFFVMGMRIWETIILTDRSWCDRAIGASQESGMRSIEAIRACFDLLDEQVATLGWNSHIDAAVIALCLLSLMVIVVAGGRLTFRAGPKGVSGNIGREELPARAQGAHEAADAAEERAEQIEAETAASQPPKRKETEILE